MEIVKRKFLNVGSTYGVNVCTAAVSGRENLDAPIFVYNRRRGLSKCRFCRFVHKPSLCERFACMKNERKDGKSVFFERI